VRVLQSALVVMKHTFKIMSQNFEVRVFLTCHIHISISYSLKVVRKNPLSTRLCPTRKQYTHKLAKIMLKIAWLEQ
jgi:hypothetical protein